MNKKVLLLLLITFPCFAEYSRSSSSKKAHNLPVYFELQIGTAFSKAANTGGTEPTLLAWRAGLTSGLKIFSNLLLGIESEYQTLGQLSEVDASVGNYKGSRWNLISPTLGLVFSKWIFKVNYQFIGDYYLSKKTAGNADLAYSTPSGWKLTLAYALGPHFHLTAFYESIAFRKLRASNLSDRALDEDFRLWQMGMGLSYVF
jgi:hypothetical protein